MTTRAEQLQREIQQRTEQLERLQKDCVHQWILVGEAPELVESLIPGIYIGTTEGPISPDLQNKKLIFQIECSDCLKTMRVNLGNTCPKCFGRLGDRELRWRKDVFGINYLYFGVRIRRCPQYHYAVACDEWDQ